MFKLFIPPVAFIIRRKVLSLVRPNYAKNKLVKNLNSDKLFGGDDVLFKKHIRTATNYVEIGCGQSTVFAAKMQNLKKIVCIDTSKAWLDIVQEVATNKDIIACHADFGTLAEWGRPTSYSKINALNKYTSAIFDHCQPDLILIDGRFRVFSFLYAMANSREGTKILFDDYTNRPHYHIVEKEIKPKELFGRQALFIRENNIDTEKIKLLMSHFRYVMD
jgi:hypothetical protein